jgi:hypothetical protein
VAEEERLATRKPKVPSSLAGLPALRNDDDKPKELKLQ